MATPVQAYTSYADAADLIDVLPLLLIQRRRERQIGLKVVAAEAGVSYTTIRRMESGGGFHAYTAAAVLRWLQDELQRET